MSISSKGVVVGAEGFRLDGGVCPVRASTQTWSRKREIKADLRYLVTLKSIFIFCKCNAVTHFSVTT